MSKKSVKRMIDALCEGDYLSAEHNFTESMNSRILLQIDRRKKVIAEQKFGKGSRKSR